MHTKCQLMPDRVSRFGTSLRPNLRRKPGIFKSSHKAPLLLSVFLPEVLLLSVLMSRLLATEPAAESVSAYAPVSVLGSGPGQSSEQATTLRWRIPATVVVDRQAAPRLIAVDRGMRVTWFEPDGSFVQEHQPVVTFSASEQEKRLQERLADWRIAKNKHQAAATRRQQEAVSTEENFQQLLAQVAVATARLDGLAPELRAHDRALAEAEVAQKTLALQQAERRLARLEVLIATGTRPALDALSVEQLVRQAGDALAEAEQRLQFLRDDDQEIARAQAELRRQRQQQELGDAVDLTGWYRREAAQKQRHEAEAQQQDGTLRRSAVEVFDAMKIARSVVPLRSIAVRRVASTPTEELDVADALLAQWMSPLAVPLVVQSAPNNARAPVRQGQFTGDVLPTGFLKHVRLTTKAHRHKRATDRGAQQPKSAKKTRTKPRNSNKTAAATAGDQDVLPQLANVLAGAGLWQVLLEPGNYAITVQVGSHRDWGAPILLRDDHGRHDHTAPQVGQLTEITWHITHPGGVYRLELGEPIGQRTVVSPGEGLLWWRSGFKIGTRARWPNWSAGWLVPTQAKQLRAVVPRDIVELLRPASRKFPAEERATARTVALNTRLPLSVRRRAAMSLMATSSASLDPGPDLHAQGAGGKEPVVVPLQVARLDTTPVDPRSLNPQLSEGLPGETLDQVSRAVYWSFESLSAAEEDAAARLPLGLQMELVVELILPDIMTQWPLSAGKVADAGQAGVQRRTDAAIFVGWRLQDQWHVVDQNMAADGRGSSSRLPTGAWPGTFVVTGGVPIILPSNWGRVAWLAEEGSLVTAGEKVLELYNPSLRRRAAQDRELTNNALTNFTLAAERRRTAAVAERRQQSRAVNDAWQAHWQLMAMESDDEVAEVVAAAQAVRQAYNAANAEKRLAAFANIVEATGTVPGLLQAEQDAERSRLAAASARLELSATRRRQSWAAMEQQRQAVAQAWAEVGLHPQATLLRQAREAIARRTAQAHLRRALAGPRWQRDFEKIREQFASTDGYLRWREVYNEMNGKRGRLVRESVVWRGVTLGDIVPADSLGVEIRLPESTYGVIQPGDQLTVAPRDVPGVRLTATIIEVAQGFALPDDARLPGDQPLSARREYRVTGTVAVPKDLQGVLLPGMTIAGWLPPSAAGAASQSFVESAKQADESQTTGKSQ